MHGDTNADREGPEGCGESVGDHYFLLFAHLCFVKDVTKHAYHFYPQTKSHQNYFLKIDLKLKSFPSHVQTLRLGMKETFSVSSSFSLIRGGRGRNILSDTEATRKLIWIRIAILYILNALSISHVSLIIPWSWEREVVRSPNRTWEAQRGRKSGSGSHGERNKTHQTHSLFKNIITGSVPCFFNTLQSCSYKCSKKNFGIFAVA